MTTPIPERGPRNLERILETAHEAFISIDDEGRVLAWNPEAERTFGWRREWALGRLLRDLIIPEPFRDRHQEGLRRFLETGEGPLIDKRIEITALHRSGRELPVELTISALPENGTWTFHAFIHDISDRHRANELQARLATLVEHSADAIVSRSADGTITSWNPAAEQLFGFSALEMVGQTMDRAVPPEREGEADRLLERVLAGEAIRAFETERVCKDGRRIDVSITISPIRDDAGRVREISMIARDITPRKRSERALKEAYDELERATDLKSRFIAIASHELRTPLTSITGFATTLVRRWEQLLDADKRAFLQTIEAQSARLHRIVEDVLTLSRIEAGRLTGEAEPVEIEPVARRILAELGVTANATVTVAGPGVVLANAVNVEQILVNYLDNARTYGKPPYRLDARPARDHVLVSVSDEGDGVPDEFVPILFESFTQARQGEGTGLGLAIVKGLAEGAGGSAWYERNEPQGARFCVTLPAA
ncbi:MAG: PAS domain S-box protein [Actinomycetota bacterium]|nr:PAS domain S-box protein [Actinomycetota bacterium]